MRRLILVLAVLLATGMVYAGDGVDNNIARGLLPTADQHIQVLATYRGVFRILARKDYQDAAARFSPMDLAVSDGRLADPNYYPQIEVVQSNRFLSININPLPFTAKELREHVDNIHVIPGNELVARQLQQIQAGDLVRLKGYLVEVGDRKSTWRSSLNNDATGDGACKVMRIESIEWDEKAGVTP